MSTILPKVNEMLTVNHGFWDRPPDDRAAIKDTARERGGVSDFFDLSPEERDRAYEDIHERT